MSIATRINAIEEHIGNAYNKLDDLGIDLTNVDKNINNIAEMLDTVYEDYPKVTGTGTEVTLDGTKAGKLGLDIKGNSVQDGTPTPETEVPILSAGDDIQLFDKNNANIINAYINNGTITEASNGKSLYISCKPNTTYTILRNAGTRFRAVDTSVVPAVGVVGSDYVGADTSSSITITTNASAKYLCVNYYNRNTDGADEQSILDSIRIYAPRSISEKIVNKNWFDKANISWYRNNLSDFSNTLNSSTTRIRTNSFEIQGGKIYIVSGYPSSVTLNAIRTFNKNKQYLRQITGVNSFTLTSEEKYIHFLFGGTNFDNSTNTMMANANIQIEQGSTATTYTAHAEQTYTIPVQQPMRSIGTVRDEFIQDTEGNWFERHNIARVVLNGTENWSLYSESGDASRRFGISYPGYLKPQQALSNYFICEYNDGTNKTTNVLFFNKGGFYLGVTDNINTWDGVQTFKTWLSTHNVEVIYELATPTDLPCTAEQVEYLENLPKSYNEQTNVYSLDVTPAYIEAKALKGE